MSWQKIDMDPIVLREMNMVNPGDAPGSYDGGAIDSCCIDECLEAVKRKLIGTRRIRAGSCRMAKFVPSAVP